MLSLTSRMYLRGHSPGMQVTYCIAFQYCLGLVVANRSYVGHDLIEENTFQKEAFLLSASEQYTVNRHHRGIRVGPR